MNKRGIRDAREKTAEKINEKIREKMVRKVKKARADAILEYKDESIFMDYSLLYLSVW
jgi:hypothetical protein